MSKSLVFEVESYDDENSKFISRVIRAMSVIFLFQWPCVDLLRVLCFLFSFVHPWEVMFLFLRFLGANDVPRF